MNNSITNTATASGTFNELLTAVSDTIVTAMTEELIITKTADKQMWADNNLTYTVVIENISTTLPYEGVTFTDVIDPVLASLVPETVTLNGTTVIYTYDDATGLLTISLGDIPAPGTATVRFEIAKK